MISTCCNKCIDCLYYEALSNEVADCASVDVCSCSFTASGPTVWNSLPEYLRDPTLSVDTFRRYLKTYFLLDINIQATS